LACRELLAGFDGALAEQFIGQELLTTFGFYRVQFFFTGRAKRKMPMPKLIIFYRLKP